MLSLCIGTVIGIGVKSVWNGLLLVATYSTFKLTTMFTRKFFVLLAWFYSKKDLYNSLFFSLLIFMPMSPVHF